MNKQELRKEFKEKRKSLSLEVAGRLSELIAGHAVDFLEKHPEFRHIHVFLPIKKNKEVDTFPILGFLEKNGYTIYTSSVDAEREEMLTLDITGVREFELNDMGIPEPVSKVLVDPGKVQLVLVPLLVVDSSGHRLGYGKGFYDKFFERIGRDVFKLGVSFFAPVYQVGSEEHDVALDACVFPEGVVVF